MGERFQTAELKACYNYFLKKKVCALGSNIVTTRSQQKTKFGLKKKFILYVQLSFIYVDIASINWIFVKIFSFNNIIDDV